MNKDHIKGKYEQTKGEVKGDFGDKVKGTIREGIADIKDKARDIKDKLNEKKREDTPDRRAV